MLRIAVAAVSAGACLLSGCASGRSEFIGTARMLADLTIEQQIVERSAGGDPAYRETLDLVGGLRPGEMKAVPAG